MSRPVAFYHVAAIGHWKEIVAEQLGVLARAGFPGRIHIGFLGGRWEDGFLAHVAEGYGLDVEVRHFGGDFQQFEFPTLAWMQEVAGTLPAEVPMLYFHGKGVSRTDWQWTMWRWLMGAYCLAGWCEMVAALDAKNCAGVSWVASGFPVAYIPGNFWWSTAGFVQHLTPFAEYVRQFSECIRSKNPHRFTVRHAAECWLNSRCDADPHVFGPQESRMWDHRWWTHPGTAEWCRIAYQKGH